MSEEISLDQIKHNINQNLNHSEVNVQVDHEDLHLHESCMDILRGCFSCCFGRCEGGFEDEDQTQDETIVKSEAELKRATVSYARMNSETFRAFAKSMSSFSLSTLGFTEDGLLKRQNYSYVSLYHKMMDTVNEHWNIHVNPKQTKMTVFPQKMFESLLRRPSLIEQFGKDDQKLSMWSPNIGMVSFSIKDGNPNI